MMTEDQFVGALRAFLAESPEQDLRRSPRVSMHGTVWLMPDADNGKAPDAVQMRNFSRVGIGITTHRPMPPGHQAAVLLPQRDAEPLTLMCRVVYCQADPHGGFRIGLQIDAEVSFEAPAPLL